MYTDLESWCLAERPNKKNIRWRFALCFRAVLSPRAFAYLFATSATSYVVLRLCQPRAQAPMR